MTLKEYVKSLAERIYRIETDGGGGSQGGATKEYVDTKVATATGILQNEINTTNQIVDGNITDVSTLQGQMSTAQGDIAQLEIDVDTNTEDIGKNTNAIVNNTQLINQVNGQVEINTADIGMLSGRVTSAETLVGNQSDLPDATKSVAQNVAQCSNNITSMKVVDNLGTLSVSAINTWQSKTVTSIANYRFLYMEWLTSNYSTLQTIFMPISLFRTHNSESKRVILKFSDDRVAQIYYVSDTSIYITQTSVTDTIKVYGIG